MFISVIIESKKSIDIVPFPLDMRKIHFCGSPIALHNMYFRVNQNESVPPGSIYPIKGAVTVRANKQLKTRKNIFKKKLIIKNV
jgi:hypothetical protein